MGSLITMMTFDHVQVYLVVGGRSRSSSSLASTELLLEGASSWTKADPLPHFTGCTSDYGLKTVSIDNHIISTGEDIT